MNQTGPQDVAWQVGGLGIEALKGVGRSRIESAALVAPPLSSPYTNTLPGW
jgi:hypothetical protein